MIFTKTNTIALALLVVGLTAICGTLIAHETAVFVGHFFARILIP